MPQTAERLMTVTEFAQLPDPLDGGKLELVDGRVVHMAPVGPGHGEGAAGLSEELSAFTRAHALGRVRVETGYRLPVGNATVRAPDVSFVTAGRRAHERLVDGFVDGIPDLAVEIVSPGDTETAIAAKVLEYLASGVQRVWVVRPELRNVTVHRPGGDSHTYSAADTLTSGDAGFAAGGFALPLSRLFDDD